MIHATRPEADIEKFHKSRLRERAQDYLKRKGLQGNILRETTPKPTPLKLKDDGRDQALKTAKERIGANFEEFKADAQKAGWTVRAMCVDGKEMVGLCDFRPNRINVAVAKGLISEVRGIG